MLACAHDICPCFREPISLSHPVVFSPVRVLSRSDSLALLLSLSYSPSLSLACSHALALTPSLCLALPFPPLCLCGGAQLKEQAEAASRGETASKNPGFCLCWLFVGATGMTG